MPSADRRAFYPLYADICGKLCIVIGGGGVAERKARMLARFGARVLVISPRVTSGLLALEKSARIEILRRPYADGDLRNAFLVFAATNNGPVNAMVRAEAVRNRILVNVVDDPDLCDFIAPSVVRRGPITVAISTSGTLPMLAKRLRKDIEGLITRDHAVYAKKVGLLRRTVITKVRDRARKAAIMRRLSMLSVQEVAAMSQSELRRLIEGDME